MLKDAENERTLPKLAKNFKRNQEMLQYRTSTTTTDASKSYQEHIAFGSYTHPAELLLQLFVKFNVFVHLISLEMTSLTSINKYRGRQSC